MYEPIEVIFMFSLWGEYLTTLSHDMLMLFLMGVVMAMIDFRFRKNPRRYQINESRWQRHARQARRRVIGYTVAPSLIYLGWALWVPSTMPLRGNWPQRIIDASMLTGVFMAVIEYQIVFFVAALILEKRRRKYDGPPPREQSQPVDGSHESLP